MLYSLCVDNKPEYQGHIKGLDGIRGIAIILVMVFHFFVEWPYWTHGNFWINILGFSFRLCDVGVQTFFVLSGYLISGILLDQRSSNGYFFNFISRRTLRIFPLYYSYLLIMLVFFPMLIGEDYTKLFRNFSNGDMFWFFSYSSNVLFFINGHYDYPLFLVVTWSLAVEEQFYLFWPFVIKYFSLKNLFTVVYLLITFSLFCRGYFALTTVDKGSGWTFLVICNFDMLCMGTFIALLLRESNFRKKLWNRITICGLIALPFFVVISFVFKHGIMREVFARFCWGLFSMSLVTLVINNRVKWYVGIVSSTVLTLFGKYSYGLYLMHTIVFAFIVPWNDSQGIFDIVLLFSVYILVSILLSMIVYQVIEKPFLKLKRFFSYS
ncbi:acyltransferase family protein [Candidatus Uabimicrobium sp. HlEnr_7]|uniref:acyltransferase family protein n=1 Tax=Candidatus Uabimicrobium helgolandensis TaxID=3095367 RepID=UPI0035579A95